MICKANRRSSKLFLVTACNPEGLGHYIFGLKWIGTYPLSFGNTNREGDFPPFGCRGTIRTRGVDSSPKKNWRIPRYVPQKIRFVFEVPSLIWWSEWRGQLPSIWPTEWNRILSHSVWPNGLSYSIETTREASYSIRWSKWRRRASSIRSTKWRGDLPPIRPLLKKGLLNGRNTVSYTHLTLPTKRIV